MKGRPEFRRIGGSIGDNIATIAIIRGTRLFSSTCAQLTQCVMNLIPTANRTDNWSVIRGETKMELTDGPDDFSEVTPESFLGSAFVDHMFQRSHYSYTVSNCYATVLVEYETEPVITPGGSLKAASRLFRKRWRTKTLSASLGNAGGLARCGPQQLVYRSAPVSAYGTCLCGFHYCRRRYSRPRPTA